VTTIQFQASLGDVGVSDNTNGQGVSMAVIESPGEPAFSARRIGVVGAGYVGLPLAAVLSHRGHMVTLAEQNDFILEMLSHGMSPIVEQGLEELLAEGISTGRLRLVKHSSQAAEGAEFVFLCVGTPQAPDGSADLRQLLAAVSELASHLSDGAILINKSTSPVGTLKIIERIVARPDVAVVSNPEFLREGSAVADSLDPDRVVVGADDPAVASRVVELFGNCQVPVVITDSTTSELIKYASNAFLAMKLTFVNTMARLCEAVGADVQDLVRGIGYDKRIGFDFMRPGPGWGGSCLPKDTAALMAIADLAGVDMGFLRAAIAGNEAQLDHVVEKIRTAVGGDLNGRVIGVLGLTFKANTNDRRNSPAVWITQRLAAKGAVVRAFDPTVRKDTVDIDDLSHVEVFDDPYAAVAGSHAIAILTEWQEFSWLDFARIREEVKDPVIVDARSLLEVGSLQLLGFTHSRIGQ
jgi:UDPglucose 6-dehydrogenase